MTAAKPCLPKTPPPGGGRAGRWLRLACLAILAGCGGGEPPPADDAPVAGTEIVNLTRTWSFRYTNTDQTFLRTVSGSPHHRAGFGNLGGPDTRHTYSEAPGPFLPLPRGPESRGEVYSNATGSVYGVLLDSPVATADNDFAVESWVEYEQHLFYRKVADDASLRLLVSVATLEATSGNTAFTSDCNPSNVDTCLSRLEGVVQLVVELHRVRDNALLVEWRGDTLLAGQQDAWHYKGTDALGDAGASIPIWTDADVVKEYFREAGFGSHHARASLRNAATIQVPLGSIGKGEAFYIRSWAGARTYNGMQRESGITAWLQDPISGSAMETELSGVEPVAVPDPLPPRTPRLSLPACSGPPDAAAGTIEWVASEATVNEGGRARLVLRRVGGAKGAVSVSVGAGDLDATSGADYALLTQTVSFADGRDGERWVDVQVAREGQLESDERFQLTLSDPRGCVALGAVTTTTVTIADHETRHQTYTLGGTVSGLVGGGLFVRSNGFDVRVDASGPFTLPGRFDSGTVYDLQIEVQPGNPLQVCRVTNGQGTVAHANVTDLAVACDPPAPPPGGALDPGFGGGKVVNPSHGGIVSMALQPDGRIVVLTDFNKLLRYQADGTLDASFGSNGVVNATLGGSALDLLRAVAMQADGGILVAGLARAGGGSASGDDMGVKRYRPDGTVDTTFGTAGFVRVDIAGRADDAAALAVQGDGKIVLGGLALVTAVGASDFALARLQADGGPDAGFGAGGKLTINVGGDFDSAKAMALQADGAIVLVGRTAANGGATPDTGIVRVSAGGVPELALRLPLTADWDEATGVAIQPDGRIVLTLEARTEAGGPYGHALARLNADGTLDDTFGTRGLAHASFSVGGDHARAPVVLADGRILTAGFARGTASQLSDFDDFLVTRHLADGSLDGSFGTGGQLVVDFLGASDGARCLLLQPDGRAVVGGLARSGTANGLGLLRVLP